MDIQTEKLDLIDWIARITDVETLEKLRSLMVKHRQNNEITEKISVAERESVYRGLKDFEEGKTHSHEEARKIYEKYL